MAGLGRLDGWSVGVIANNPMFQAGALNPNSCDKAIRLLCLCDAFNIPIIGLMDVPSFNVGRKAEYDRMLFAAIRMVEAPCNLSTPTISVVIRKSIGLAYQAMNTSGMGAWGFLFMARCRNRIYGSGRERQYGLFKQTGRPRRRRS